MIVGLSKITGGDIYIKGHSVRSDFTLAMRDIGCIVETPEMYKYMSGLDNLKMFAKLYGIGSLTMVDKHGKFIKEMGEFADRYV